MARPLDDFRATHKLCDVLARNGIFVVRFTDGRDFELSDCWPVDSSIYDDTGRWCCRIEQYLGQDEKGLQLFRLGGGVDIMEDDIVSIADKITGEILFSKTS